MKKIFVIGLPRSGTTSMNNALEILGYISKHNPTGYRELQFDGCYKFPGTWDALTNFGEHSYPQLDFYYPGSKFILTVRNKTKWLDSIKWKQQTKCKEERGNKIRIDTFGTHKFNEQRYSYVYDLHYKNAVEYFKDRPDDFLIMRLDEGDGWEKLCPFLGKEIPETPFPHTHTRAEMIEERKNKTSVKKTSLQKVKSLIKRLFVNKNL